MGNCCCWMVIFIIIYSFFFSFGTVLVTLSVPLGFLLWAVTNAFSILKVIFIFIVTTWMFYYIYLIAVCGLIFWWSVVMLERPEMPHSFLSNFFIDIGVQVGAPLLASLLLVNWDLVMYFILPFVLAFNSMRRRYCKYPRM